MGWGPVQLAPEIRLGVGPSHRTPPWLSTPCDSVGSGLKHINQRAVLVTDREFLLGVGGRGRQ